MNDYDVIMKVIRDAAPNGVLRKDLNKELLQRGFDKYQIVKRLQYLIYKECVRREFDEQTRKYLLYYVKDFEYTRVSWDKASLKKKVVEYLKDGSHQALFNIQVNLGCSVTRLVEAISELMSEGLVDYKTEKKARRAKRGHVRYFYCGD